MKIPEYIKRKMHSAAKNFQQGAALMADVDKWFDAHGFPAEVIRSGDGTSLEEIEYGNDVTEVFCARIEAAQAGEGEHG